MRTRALAALLVAAVAGSGGAALPVHAASGAAEGNVAGAGLPGTIPGQYVVTVADGGFQAAGAEAATTTYVARMGAGQARRLAANPRVRLVEQDRILTEQQTQASPTWGIDRIDQRSARLSRSYTPTDDGSSVHAYVIDSGIRISHREFGGRATYGYDFIDNDSTASDCDGHGTHVAGTIGGSHYGVAKKVRLVAVRVLNCKGAGTLSGVVKGIDWVTRHAVHPAVANLSLGGDHSPSLEAAVQRSINSGVTFAVAAGNEHVNAATTSPAGLRAAITVGATDRRDRRASFSNYGSVLDLFAPGVNIVSAWSTGDTAAAVASGTSMASPHVAGAAALVLDEFPAMTPAQVRGFLVGRATTGRVTDRAGSPNRLLFAPAPVAPPVIKTAGITMRAGRPYVGRLALTAGRRGSWSLASGALPLGMSLAGTGVISGTPVAAGTATITVRFVDYVPNTVTRRLTVTVQPSPDAV
nr:S8 family serine peptidase [uncultured Actinoplanes sp.]